jgi:hypothetical protein
LFTSRLPSRYSFRLPPSLIICLKLRRRALHLSLSCTLVLECMSSLAGLNHRRSINTRSLAGSTRQTLRLLASCALGPSGCFRFSGYFSEIGHGALSIRLTLQRRALHLRLSESCALFFEHPSLPRDLSRRMRGRVHCTGLNVPQANVRVRHKDPAWRVATLQAGSL